jgi:YggT family protein
MGYAIVWLVNNVIGLIIFLVIVQAILSWLIAFNVVNVRNRFVYQVAMFLDRLTDPLLRPIRRFMPNLGGIDISPVILLLALQFVQIAFNRTAAPALVGYLG